MGLFFFIGFIVFRDCFVAPSVTGVTAPSEREPMLLAMTGGTLIDLPHFLPCLFARRVPTGLLRRRAARNDRSGELKGVFAISIGELLILSGLLRRDASRNDG